MSEAKGFIIYTEWQKIFAKLSDAQAGRLIKAMMSFAVDGTKPDFEDDPRIDMAFSFIEDAMKRNVEKYQEICQKRSEYGKMGGRGHKKEKVSEESQESISFNDKAKESISFNDKAKKPIQSKSINKSINININKSKSIEEEEEAPLQSASASSLSESDLIEEFGADVVSEYKQRVSAWCSKNNRPSKNTLQTVREWIIKDGAGKGTKNEPVVIYSTSSFDVKQIEDDIWAQYD